MFFSKDTPLTKFCDVAVIPYYKKACDDIRGISFERWKFVMSLYYMFAFITYCNCDRIDGFGEKLDPSIKRYAQKYDNYKAGLCRLIKDVGNRSDLEGVWIAANLWVKSATSLTKENIRFGRKIADYVVALIKSVDGDTLLS